MLNEKDSINLSMNMIFHDKVFYNSFREYLNEGISIKKTEYGLNNPDFNNNEINDSKGVIYTFFVENNNVYIVMIKRYYEVVFTKVKDYNTMEFYDGLTADRNQFKVFGKVMYVVIEMMKKLKIDYVYFDGLTKKHTKIYTTLFNSKSIQKEAKKYNIDLEIRTNQVGIKKFYIVQK